jgi:hypothetical protein
MNKKKPTSTSKLTLARQTVRNLSTSELATAAGGLRRRNDSNYESLGTAAGCELCAPTWFCE